MSDTLSTETLRQIVREEIVNNHLRMREQREKEARERVEKPESTRALYLISFAQGSGLGMPDAKGRAVMEPAVYAWVEITTWGSIKDIEIVAHQDAVRLNDPVRAHIQHWTSMVQVSEEVLRSDHAR